MNDIQAVLWTMFQSVIKFMDSVIDQLTKPAAILKSYNKFKGVVAEIEDIDSGKKQITAGKVETKNKLRLWLEEETFNFAASLHSYAIENGLNELKAGSGITMSELSNMREASLYSKAKAVNKLAKENPAAMDEGDITIEEVNTHDAEAEKFKSSIGDVGTSGEKSKEQTEKEASLFSNATHILEDELDVHMLTRRRKTPEIFSGYEASRKKKVTGVRHEAKPEENPAVPQPQ